MTRHLFGLLLIFWIAVVHAQYRPNSTLYQVETKDGNIYIGHILSQLRDELTLETQNIGVITIKTSEIRRVDTANEGSNAPTKRIHGLHSSSYFNLPSSYGLRKGETYIKNTMLFVNHGAVGLTDRFTLAGGSVPLFLISQPHSPLWFTPKISIPVSPERVNFSISPMVVGITGYKGIFTLIHPTGTLGGRDKNLTGGLIFGFYRGQLFKIPVLTLSGTYRIGEKWQTMSENYLTRQGGVTMLGARRMYKHFSLDYGLAGFYDTKSNYGATPWLSLIIPLYLWDF